MVIIVIVHFLSMDEYLAVNSDATGGTLLSVFRDVVCFFMRTSILSDTSFKSAIVITELILPLKFLPLLTMGTKNSNL